VFSKTDYWTHTGNVINDLQMTIQMTLTQSILTTCNVHSLQKYNKYKTCKQTQY